MIGQFEITHTFLGMTDGCGSFFLIILFIFVVFLVIGIIAEFFQAGKKPEEPVKLMPTFDTWEAVGVNVPEDMRKEYPIGTKFADGAAGVVVGYELSALYNGKPAWLVVVLFEDGKMSSFERFWLQGNRVQEVIQFTSPEDLVAKANKTWNKSL